MTFQHILFNGLEELKMCVIIMHKNMEYDYEKKYNNNITNLQLSFHAGTYKCIKKKLYHNKN